MADNGLVYPAAAPVYNDETGEYEHREEQASAHNILPEIGTLSASFAPPTTGLHLAYWTTFPSDYAEIELWLNEHITTEGVDPHEFYGSFVNWCTIKMQRLGNGGTQWHEGEQEVAEQFHQQLRWTETGAPAFIHLLEHFLASSWTLHRGTKADAGDIGNIAKAQEELYKILFSRDERMQHWEAAGNDPSQFDAKTRKKAAQKNRKRLEGLARAALAMMGEDVGEVEGEKEGDDGDEGEGKDDGDD